MTMPRMGCILVWGLDNCEQANVSRLSGGASGSTQGQIGGAPHQVPTAKRDLDRLHEVDAYPSSDGKDDEGDNLRDDVEPPGQATREDTHEDGTEGEENDDG